MEVYGKGERKILIVGEAPGYNEDKEGRPFIGETGTYLKNRLKEIGIKMDRDCWLTNALICHPEKNRTPTSEEISYCHPNIARTIKELEPNVILTVGKAAIESVTTGIWTEGIGAMSRWAGWKIPCRDLNTWIIPTFHPSFIKRELSEAKNGTPIEKIYGEHLELLNTIDSKPYKKVKDLRKSIQLLYEPDKIVKKLNWFRKHPAPIAFDLETDRLKPDHPKSTIRCASVCWKGKKTIAFPYEGRRVKNAFRKLLASPCPKYGQNFKFEDRWTHDPVVNWTWDTMNEMHVYDPRKGICSLSFIGFVLLGISCYSDHISPFLSQEDSYAENRIKEVELKDLLLYNGFDSLVTYMAAVKQMKLLGVKP